MERSHPSVLLFHLLVFAATPLVAVVFFTDLAPALRLPVAYAIPALMLSAIGVATRLFALGPGPLPKAAFLVGAAWIAGTVTFDVTATLLHSPDLSDEQNPIARALLDSGHSLSFVYAYGFAGQAMLVLWSIIMWGAFLKHRETLLALVAETCPRTYPEYLKTAMGGRHLTWRQFLFPYKPSELPHPYYIVWPMVFLLTVGFAYRLYLGLEWFRLVPWMGLKSALLVALAGFAGYLLWLYQQYRLQKG